MKGDKKRGIIMREIAVFFKKTVTSWNFWLCVGATAALLFFSVIYEDTLTGNRYSVLNALFSFSADEMKSHYEFCNIYVYYGARGSWFSLFVPIIAAFCFVPEMCAEREENALRFQVVRSSKTKWQLSNFFSGIISGGTAVTLGYVIFSGLVMLLFPGVSEMDSFAAETATMMSGEFYILVLDMWVFAIFWSIPSMFLTSVLQSKYLIICIPFFLKYALSQLFSKLTMDAWNEDHGEGFYEMLKFINPDGLMDISMTKYYETFIMYGILLAVSLATFMIIERKRGDFGA